MNTIPGMPCINHDQSDIDGMRVERFTTTQKDAAQRPPLLCVHGGCHASWSWQEHAPVYLGSPIDRSCKPENKGLQYFQERRYATPLGALRFGKMSAVGH